MRRIQNIWLLLASFVFISRPVLPASISEIQSINDPPALQANPALLRSNLPITTQNADRLVVAAEIFFNPWGLATALAWSPKGEILAIAAGAAIYLLDASEWRVLGSFNLNSLTHSLAFSQDGNWLAAGSRDGLVRCWFRPVNSITEFGETTASVTFQAHKKGVNDLAFSPDGSILASGGNDAVARFWDLDTRQLSGLVIGGTFAVPSIAFEPDGASLAVANGKMIRLRQVGSERILGSFLADEPLFSLAYSPDGSWLAAGDTLNQVLLWKPEQAFRTGQENYVPPVLLSAHRGKPGTYHSLIWDVEFSRDSQLLVSAGGDTTIRLWDTRAAGLIGTLTGHNAAVTGARLNDQTTALASSGLDGRVLVWKIDPIE